MNGPYAVILTGGAPPDGTEHADPPRNQLDLAIERGTGDDGPVLRHVAEEAWLLGYKEAAALHRTVAVWVLGSDEDEAKRFAEFVTREIDPAYVTTARSPLGEMLTAAEAAGYRVPQDEVPY